MARRVFFCFHYQRDIFRVNQVRQSWRIRSGNDTQPFLDRSLWEETQRRGDDAIRQIIDQGLSGASVTVVLLGAETDRRKWVEYEIEKSYKDGKGLLAVRIHGIKNQNGFVDHPGTNPFDRWHVTKNGQIIYFSQMFQTYDWIGNDGYHNLETWIEQAATARAR